ncbi:MAG: GNAT family N-acetyltransferase [Muribaculaceae bacterium]|nr:GNAT family N-acetyltransferase [Muribaculaceae bacterium]
MTSLRLRAVEPADADLLFDIENDQSAWHNSDMTAPYSHHMLRLYAEHYNADPFSAGELRLVAELRDENDPASSSPVGILDFYDISALHSTAWVGIYVVPGMRRKGLALEMLAMAKEYATAHLGLSHIGARILRENTGSMRLFEKAGYTLCGTLPGWRYAGGHQVDLHLYSITL